MAKKDRSNTQRDSITECLICQSNNITFQYYSQNKHGRHLISKEKFKIFKCLNCQSLLLDTANLKINKHFFQKYYSSDYYPQISNLTKIYITLTNWIRNKIIFDNISPKIKRPKVLDVGCGSGYFLTNLPPHFQKHGIDINPTAAKLYKRNKISFINADFLNISLKTDNYDLITSFHVIEHISDPQLFIDKIYNYLKPGGTAIISFPNSQSLGSTIGRQNWFHLDSPRHLFIPNKNSIRILISKYKISTPRFFHPYFDFPLDLYWSAPNILSKIFIILFYFPLRLFDRETLIFTFQKPKK